MSEAAQIAEIRRPKILIRAARAAVSEYQRDRDLKRLLRINKAARDNLALGTLIDEERRLESKRTSGEATYSIQRHVAILTALIAETRCRTATLH
jgi:hypothetical protein